ncbi:MAG: universal stress protein [Bacteroidota bacterium]|nr:universal stress protein [Bacteroidota bacterium]MDX5404145.1 universal stress protein [Bacteroidota bacterium]MDX5428177.1 universal stress protein [Bacteroidota bacterium]MDX5447834.1 universal stress protein [Bacteroidota bacterium]MDX5505961.1 universal stress protein [Bacteroidota bacterium]
MKSLIFPTDFSPNAEKAFEYACMIAQKGNLEMIIANAYDLPYSQNVMTTSLLEILKETSEKGVDEVRAKAQAKGLRCHSFSLMGNPIRVVKDLVKRFPDSMVVMGTKGASGIEEVLIGSNTASVLHSVDVPVLAIPEDAEVVPFDRIVYASDYLSKKNDRALSRLAYIAELFSSKLDIIHIEVEHERGQKEEAIKKFDHHFANVKYEIHELKGEDIQGTILHFAKDNHAQMVALLARKYGLIEGLFHRSVTSKVAYHSHIPFLALHEFEM